MSEDPPNLSYNVILLGDGGVGKTTFLKRHLTGEFETKYLTTIGIEDHPLLFHTNRGPIKFIVRDTSHGEHGLRGSYYSRMQAAIIMFDVTNRTSYKLLSMWFKDARNLCGDIPIVILGNKVDIEENRKVKQDQIKFPIKKNLKYYEVSSKTNFHLEEPFLHLARCLTEVSDLEFVQNVCGLMMPCDIVMDEETMRRYQMDLEMASTCELPDDDEDL